MRLSLVLPLVFCACAKIGVNVGPTPTPSPTPSPAACTTGPSPNATVLVGMSVSILPTVDSTYGTVSGYGPTDSTLTVPVSAAVIKAKTTDVVQFVNLEASTLANHSAVGFPSQNFPAVPYSFPSTTQNAIGTRISATQWSTGLIPIAGSFGSCFSQTFTVTTPGVYYFGDYQLYNSSNFRDAIVVTQ